MDDFLTELENAPQERFDEKAFKEPERSELWWEIIHNINIHNAYHLGQIMMIKKKCFRQFQGFFATRRLLRAEACQAEQ